MTKAKSRYYERTGMLRNFVAAAIAGLTANPDYTGMTASQVASTAMDIAESAIEKAEETVDIYREILADEEDEETVGILQGETAKESKLDRLRKEVLRQMKENGDDAPPPPS
jgi:rubrerythrin